MKNKIAIEQGTVKILEDNRILIQFEELEEPKTIVLQDEFKKLGEEVTLTAKPYKPKKEKEKIVKYEYSCRCGTKFKFKTEDISIHCKTCGHDFEIEE